jgi:hypothetical protein
MELLDGNFLKYILMLGNMSISLAAFLILLYSVQVQSMKSRTKRYKFVSEKERSALQFSAVLVAVSVCFYSFLLLSLTMGPTGNYQFIFAGFFALIFGYALGRVLWKYLSFYHPFILEKKLKDIRFAPMKSPTGNTMTLLNEEQEDAHLSQKMIDEEDTLSVDYDVWIDQRTDYKVIERYDTRFHSLVCDNCNFRTLVERSVEVSKEPGQNEKGVLTKLYECTYCGHKEVQNLDIPSWEEEHEYDKYVKDVVG